MVKESDAYGYMAFYDEELSRLRICDTSGTGKVVSTQDDKSVIRNKVADYIRETADQIAYQMIDELFPDWQ